MVKVRKLATFFFLLLKESDTLIDSLRYGKFGTEKIFTNIFYCPV